MGERTFQEKENIRAEDLRPRYTIHLSSRKTNVPTCISSELKSERAGQGQTMSALVCPGQVFEF